MFGLKFSPKAVEAPAAVEAEAAETAWGFTPAQWLNLTPEARRDYRDRIAYAGRADGLGRPVA